MSGYGSTWDPRQPWKGGEKRGDMNETRVCEFVVRRWQFGITRRYVGDLYGFIGSDGWTWSFTLVRNPSERRPRP